MAKAVRAPHAPPAVLVVLLSAAACRDAGQAGIHLQPLPVTLNALSSASSS